MKFKETLTWILDNDEKRGYPESYQFNIDFVHSLGLKCDCVGWSELDLNGLNADKILSEISSFCKENGYRARGYYDREYTDYESDWYELKISPFKDDTVHGSDEYITDDGKITEVLAIRAYKEKRVSLKNFSASVFVPERFRDVFVRHNINDVVFCWSKDIGRYDAEQYFEMFGNVQIPRIADDSNAKIFDKERMQLLGGYLPRLAEIFSDLRIDLQNCYIESDMPNCNIANASIGSKNEFLIHKKFAELLLKERVISERDIRPALVVKDFLPGFFIKRTEMRIRPKTTDLEKSIFAYEKLKNTYRPSQIISENEALKTLRASKRERKEDFEKTISKSVVADVEKTKYAPIVPYYLVANGGYLSDEYELLPYNEAIQENDLFVKEMCAEELLEGAIFGIVFAKCPDGDRVLLTDSGKVVRYSHEYPDVTEEWSSLAQFIVDALNSM